MIDEGSLIKTETKVALCEELKNLKDFSFGVWGFSESNIYRMADSDKIERDKILTLYKYWFQPLIKSDQYKDFNIEFISYAETQLKTRNNDFSDVITKLKEFFDGQDSEISDVHFCQLFDIFKRDEEHKNFVYNKEQIFQFISIELRKIVSNQVARTRGISDNERDTLFSQITEQLADDAATYNFDSQSPQGNYRALIRYRLCHLLYENTRGNNYKALAFSISQKDFPGNIYIHPAAKIDKNVYISEQVVIGSNCRISSNCHIGKNVCIVPFYAEQNNLLHEDIVLEPGVIVGNLAKIVGRVHIGEKSYIKTALRG